MLEWVDVTNHFSEENRHWKGRYLEVDEVANDEIECSLFSCENDDWEIYFDYGIMYGVCYASADKAREKRSQMMRDIEEEYDRHKMDPSDEFMQSFDEKYHVDVMNALF